MVFTDASPIEQKGERVVLAKGRSVSAQGLELCGKSGRSASQWVVNEGTFVFERAVFHNFLQGHCDVLLQDQVNTVYWLVAVVG